jgi:hypothetical protein
VGITDVLQDWTRWLSRHHCARYRQLQIHDYSTQPHTWWLGQ